MKWNNELFWELNDLKYVKYKIYRMVYSMLEKFNKWLLWIFYVLVNSSGYYYKVGRKLFF